MLSVILNAKFPMLLWWGPELVQFYNDAYRPSLGTNGKHPAALGQEGATCWPESWPMIKPLIDQVLAGGEATWNEDQLLPIYRNGQIENVYWTYSYSPVWSDTGEVAGVLVICQETTRQVLAARQDYMSEAYLQRIFSSAAVGIALFRGPTFIIDVANPGVCIIWGRTEADVLGKPLFDALPEAAGQGFEEILATVMRTNQPFTGRELPATINRNGQLMTVYFDFVYEPLPDDDGAVNWILVTASDATERILTRQKADLLLARERELNELKSNFVTLASHEFRTPMGTILSSAALIGRYDGPNDGEKRDRHVQRIKSAVHSLTGLLNDFLSLSQMEQATMHGSPHLLDIILFCAEVLEDMQGVIKPGQRVVYQHLSGPSLISLDGQMLKNILINLLINASKYSAGGKEIELTTTILDGQLVITVKDQGIGIPDADKDKLFINFFRARNASHIAGTGLGLYVVKRYVDLLGGLITFSSELDSGTIFTIQLPLSPVPL